MNNDLISKSRLLDVLERNFGHTGGADVLKQLIEAQPSAAIATPDNAYFIPCNVADSVYMVTACGIEVAVVDKIILMANNEMKIRARRAINGIDIVYLYLDHYKKKWFLTYEEALASRGM